MAKMEHRAKRVLSKMAALHADPDTRTPKVVPLRTSFSTLPLTNESMAVSPMYNLCTTMEELSAAPLFLHVAQDKDLAGLLRALTFLPGERGAVQAMFAEVVSYAIPALQRSCTKKASIDTPFCAELLNAACNCANALIGEELLGEAATALGSVAVVAYVDSVGREGHLAHANHNAVAQLAASLAGRLLGRPETDQARFGRSCLPAATTALHTAIKSKRYPVRDLLHSVTLSFASITPEMPAGEYLAHTVSAVLNMFKEGVVDVKWIARCALGLKEAGGSVRHVGRMCVLWVWAVRQRAERGGEELRAASVVLPCVELLVGGHHENAVGLRASMREVILECMDTVSKQDTPDSDLPRLLRTVADVLTGLVRCGVPILPEARYEAVLRPLLRTCGTAKSKVNTSLRQMACALCKANSLHELCKETVDIICLRVETGQEGLSQHDTVALVNSLRKCGWPVHPALHRTHPGVVRETWQLAPRPVHETQGALRIRVSGI